MWLDKNGPLGSCVLHLDTRKITAVPSIGSNTVQEQGLGVLLRQDKICLRGSGFVNRVLVIASLLFHPGHLEQA